MIVPKVSLDHAAEIEALAELNLRVVQQMSDLASANRRIDEDFGTIQCQTLWPMGVEGAVICDFTPGMVGQPVVTLDWMFILCGGPARLQRIAGKARRVPAKPPTCMT